MPPKRNSNRSSRARETPTPSPRVSFGSSYNLRQASPGSSIQGSESQRVSRRTTAIPAKNSLSYGSPIAQLPLRSNVGSSRVASAAASVFIKVQQDNKESNRRRTSTSGATAGASPKPPASPFPTSPRLPTSSPRPRTSSPRLTSSPSAQRATRNNSQSTKQSQGSTAFWTNTQNTQGTSFRNSTSPEPDSQLSSAERKRKLRDAEAEADAAVERARQDNARTQQMAAASARSSTDRALHQPSTPLTFVPATTALSSSRSFDLEGRIFSTSGLNTDVSTTDSSARARLQRATIAKTSSKAEALAKELAERQARGAAGRTRQGAEEAAAKVTQPGSGSEPESEDTEDPEEVEIARRAKENAELASRKAAEDAKRNAEAEEARIAAEEAKRKAEAEEARIAAEDAKQKAEAEKARKAAADAEKAKRDQDEKDRALQAAEEVKKKKKEAEITRKKIEAEAQRKATEAYEARRQADADAKKQADAQKQAEAKKRADDEAKRKHEEAAKAAKAKAAADAQRKADLEVKAKDILDKARREAAAEELRKLRLEKDSSSKPPEKVASSFKNANKNTANKTTNKTTNKSDTQDSGMTLVNRSPSLSPEPPSPFSTHLPKKKKKKQWRWTDLLLLLLTLGVAFGVFTAANKLRGPREYCLTSEQFGLLSRYFEDQDSLTPTNRDTLKTIIPGFVYVKRDRKGKVIIDEDFWQGIRDRIKGDDSILDVNNLSGLLGRDWQDVKARLEQLETGTPGESSQSWDSWLRNNKRKVAEILGADVKKSVIDSLPSSIVTRDEFLQEIERAVAQQAQTNESHMAQLRNSIQHIVTELNKLRSSKADSAEIATLVDKFVKKAVSHGQLKNTAQGQIGHALESHLANRINHFSPGNGAIVNSHWTSPTYIVRRSKPRQPWEAMSFFHQGVSALVSWQDAGMCWCAGAEESIPATIGIQLGNRIIPQYIAIEHINPQATIDPDSMPKDMEVWGRYPHEESPHIQDWNVNMFPEFHERDITEDERKILDHGFIMLGKFQYSYSAEDAGTYVFKFSDELGESLRAASDLFLVRATSNYGAVDHTCFYRIKMYGEIMEPIKVDGDDMADEFSLGLFWPKGYWPWNKKE